VDKPPASCGLSSDEPASERPADGPAVPVPFKQLDKPQLERMQDQRCHERGQDQQGNADPVRCSRDVDRAVEAWGIMALLGGAVSPDEPEDKQEQKRVGNPADKVEPPGDLLRTGRRKAHRQRRSPVLARKPSVRVLVDLVHLGVADVAVGLALESLHGRMAFWARPICGPSVRKARDPGGTGHAPLPVRAHCPVIANSLREGIPTRHQGAETSIRPNHTTPSTSRAASGGWYRTHVPSVNRRGGLAHPRGSASSERAVAGANSQTWPQPLRSLATPAVDRDLAGHGAGARASRRADKGGHR
jgi:hypothetical protein